MQSIFFFSMPRSNTSSDSLKHPQIDPHLCSFSGSLFTLPPSSQTPIYRLLYSHSPTLFFVLLSAKTVS